MARSVHRSTVTGKFVSKGAARRAPNRTAKEAVGKGTSNSRTVTRSATSGRFVTTAYGKRNPDGTWNQQI